jgi:hypothetical protein
VEAVVAAAAAPAAAAVQVVPFIYLHLLYSQQDLIQS